MSCSKEHSFENTRNFERLCSLKFEDTIPFYMYRSVNTGITVCIAETDGPFINGYFNIVTETFDNDGLAYALTMLIFAGSENCPHYSNLYFWNNRNLGNIISGNVLKDRTYFTLSAAGSKAFLTLMPMFVDHILYPSLKDSAYLIDVHHIIDTRNGGKTYRRVQNVERTSVYNIEREMFRALFSEPCGYRSLILGTTKSLRESTTIEKLKQFHKKFYRPENLTILITGKIKHDQIFQALLPLEQKILSEKRKDIFKKPWQIPIEQLKESVEVDVAVPSPGNTYDSVYVAWQGPSPITQIYDYRGCLLLLEYLTQTSSSPLTKDFVKKNKLSCTIQCRSFRWPVSVLNIIFKDVPIDKINLITKTSVHEIFNDLYTNGINMETMKTVIHRLILHYNIILENNPHDNIASVVFDHIIYGNTTNLDQSLNNIRDLEKLKVEPEEYFLHLLKTYFVDAPIVVVRGKPSLDEYRKLQEEEKHIAEQIAKLGINCLEQKKKELQQAIKDCNFVPYKVITKVPELDTDSIIFHDIERYNTETLKQHPKLDVTKLPLFTHLDHVNTNFVYLQVIIDTSYLNAKDRYYIPLLNELITESPVKRENQLIPYEKIKDLLAADTIRCKSHFGININGNYSNSISLVLQVELQNYEKGVQWCKELLYDSKLTAKRLKKVVTQLIRKFESYTKGENLVKTLLDIVLYQKDTNQFTCNTLRQYTFYSDIMDNLDIDGVQNYLITEIESVRKLLISPKNMFVYMAVNVDKLTEQVSDVYAPWNKYFSDLVTSEKPKPNITADWELLKSFDWLIYNGSILGLEHINSTFFAQTCPCINNVQHADFPALIVCVKYFIQIGGPMWKTTINKATSYNLHVSPDEGLLWMELFHADILSVYKDLKLIAETHIAKTKWNQYLYESAKSLAILNCVNEANNVRRMIELSLKCYCRNVPYDDYIHQIVQHISAVTMDDMNRVRDLYIKPLFNPRKCKTAIVCNISKVAEIESAFHKMNFSLKVYKSLEDLKAYVERVIYRKF